MKIKNTKPSIATVCALFIVILGTPYPCWPAQESAKSSAQSLRLEDDSDWWSISKGSDSIEGATEQNRQISDKNFRILGIALDEDLLERAARKLGNASVVRRGDGGESRAQACYASNVGKPKTYLVFETGEVNFAYHLFQGPAWKGSENCLATELVDGKTSTATGLRLGQSMRQVVAILGKPSKRRERELVYVLGTRNKNSAEALQKARKAYPRMTEKEINSNFSFYDLSVCIILKFKDSRLSYLAMSKSETY